LLVVVFIPGVGFLKQFSWVVYCILYLEAFLAGLADLAWALMTFLTIFCSSIKKARTILSRTQLAQREPP
jgi:hypothetical protein